MRTEIGSSGTLVARFSADAEAGVLLYLHKDFDIEGETRLILTVLYISVKGSITTQRKGGLNRKNARAS